MRYYHVDVINHGGRRRARRRRRVVAIIAPPSSSSGTRRPTRDIGRIQTDEGCDVFLEHDAT
jgi:hypothetical protein